MSCGPITLMSYHLLGIYIDIVTGEQLDEAASLLTKALKISPGREEYATMLAQAYLRKEDPKSARRILEPLARSAANEQQRKYARKACLHRLSRWRIIWRMFVLRVAGTGAEIVS
ncbi:MAG: tetratricopeptide repeat protein [Pyrinomonadaceae bacterium]